MKLMMIGNPEIELESVWLTPEQYLKHECYHGMVKCIDGPRLFVRMTDGRVWHQISPSYSTAYQFVEGTDEEQVELWKAGYRMLGLDRPGAQRCRFCNKAMSDSDSFFGPKMWSHCKHPCRHESYIMCPSCWESPEYTPECPVCKCGELYC